MKSIIISILLLVLLYFDAAAQSDTLVIYLKNNQVEKIPISSIQKISFENLINVTEQNNPEKSLSVRGNIPNPFNNQTNIEFTIEAAGKVKIIIYDITGSQIRTLDYNECSAGLNTITWDCLDNTGASVQAGSYFYEVQYNGESVLKKMIFIK